VFACASRHVAVNGNTKREISDALSMGVLHLHVSPQRNYTTRPHFAVVALGGWLFYVVLLEMRSANDQS